MKKLFVFVLAISLFAACSNDKKAGPDKVDAREKDDYRNNDKTVTDREEENKGSTGNTENTEMSGSDWSAANKEAFLSNCIKQGSAAGTVSKDVVTNYCSCMLQKIVRLYPNAIDAAKMDLESESTNAMMTDCVRMAQNQ